jgi:hypothetical protein
MSNITWSTSLHLTFRLLPNFTPNLRPFLQADELTPSEVLLKLPYDVARSKSGTGKPDARRYRDGKQLYESIGLLYEDTTGVVRVTDLGKATLRWLALLNEKNIAVLGRHAAYALAACQLRNPTGWGSTYDDSVSVFPFSYIWRMMLSLDGCVTSDELNRAMFKVKNEKDLTEAIEKVKKSRASGKVDEMGPEVISGTAKEDRIIPWMCMASFGWTLISDKRTGEGRYCINPRARAIIREAASVRHKHKHFKGVEDYVLHVSSAAALPRDIR